MKKVNLKRVEAIIIHSLALYGFFHLFYRIEKYISFNVGVSIILLLFLAGFIYTFRQLNN